MPQASSDLGSLTQTAATPTGATPTGATPTSATHTGAIQSGALPGHAQPDREAPFDPVAPRFAINAVFLACGACMGLWATQIARIKLNFDLSDPGLASVVLAFACGSIPTMPLAGSLATRWGGVRSIRLTAIAAGVTLCLLGTAPTYPMLLLAALLSGGAIGALDVAMNGHANAIAALWRRAILSSIHGWFSLGGVVGSVAGGALTGVGVTVAVVLGLGGASLLVTGIVTTRFLHLPGEVAQSDGPAFAWPTRAVLGIGLLCLFALLIEGGIGDWTTVYLYETTGASLDWAAAGFAGFSVAMAVGRFTGDAVVDRLGSRRVIVASGLLTAAGIGLAVAVPVPAAAATGFLVAGFGMSNIVPLLFAEAGRVPGVPPAVGVAMVATMGYGAFLMGPSLIGFLAGGISLRAALLVLVACGLAIAAGGRWR